MKTNNNDGTYIFNIFRWGSICNHINTYLADVEFDALQEGVESSLVTKRIIELKSLYNSFVNFALNGHGNGLLDEINLYSDIVTISEDPSVVLTEIVVTLEDYKERYGESASKVEEAVVDFANYYADKNILPNPYFMINGNGEDEEKREEKLILPEKVVEEKPVLSVSASTKEEKVEHETKKGHINITSKLLFDLKKQVLGYKSRLDNGESLPDMIDNVLASHDVVMALQGTNNSQIMNDVNFYHTVGGNKSNLQAYENNSEIENSLVVLYAGYSLCANPVNMSSSKEYSIARDNNHVMASFEGLKNYSKVFKKALGFPTHICKK